MEFEVFIGEYNMDIFFAKNVTFILFCNFQCRDFLKIQGLIEQLSHSKDFGKEFIVQDEF